MKTTNENHTSRVTTADVADFRSPHYECREGNQSMVLSVFVPGVTSSGVEICLRGPDLIVTATRAHILRVNFSSANLESAQKDYQLCLRIGYGFEVSGLQADLDGGILTLTLPKKARRVFSAPLPKQKVA